MTFDFDDILLTPASISSINSRKEVKTTDENNMLPLFTAPMDTVISEDNWEVFKDNKIYSILPRTLNNTNIGITPFKWYSYGLDEFENTFLTQPFPFELAANPENKFYALIDIANGHMQRLLNAASKAKSIWGNQIILMIGNVANPTTYKEYAQTGVDYVRLGIGAGSVCTTSANVAIGYPMASLIVETFKIKNYLGYDTQIVADGGFKNFSDIVKALALGADYVMLGSIFNKALESASELYTQSDWSLKYEPFEVRVDVMDGVEVNMEEITKQYTLNAFNEGKLYKKYRGMSTKEVQQSWGRTELKTAEGISKYQKVEYTLSGWCENFKDYLASAMSYTDSKNLKEFKNSDYKLITQNSLNRFKK